MRLFRFRTAFSLLFFLYFLNHCCRFNQLQLHCAQLIGKVNRHNIGVFQTLLFFPEGILFSVAVCLNVHCLGAFIHQLTIHKDGNKQFAKREAARQAAACFSILHSYHRYTNRNPL